MTSLELHQMEEVENPMLPTSGEYEFTVKGKEVTVTEVFGEKCFTVELMTVSYLNPLRKMPFSHLSKAQKSKAQSNTAVHTVCINIIWANDLALDFQEFSYHESDM